MCVSDGSSYVRASDLILALVLHHDEEAVLTAVAIALDAGVPTKTHILNLLQRLLDGKPVTTPPVTAPQALRLVSEPMANVERYDALRGEARHAPLSRHRRNRCDAARLENARQGAGPNRPHSHGAPRLLSGSSATPYTPQRK